MNDYSKEMFNFKELNVEKIIDKGGEKYIYVKNMINSQICPNCGKLAFKSKGYGRTRIIKDIFYCGYPSYLVYKPKRLRCKCGKTFTVRNVDIPSKSRITLKEKEKILADLATRSSLKEIAKNNNVSEYMVGKILDCINYELDQISEIVCIDDFKGNLDGHKFQTVMCNPITGKITNIYATRKKEDLLMEISKIPKYKRDKVKIYICDMSPTYVEIGKMLFKNAEIVIDKFHYTRAITEAFEKIRKRVQSNLSDEERRYFKHNRFVLLKRKEKLKWNEKRNEIRKLDHMLNASQELTDAYNLLQFFYYVNRSNDKEMMKERLKKFANKVEESNLKEFKNALNTIRNNYEYILNSSDSKFTNSFTEGKNNNIKTMKRVGFGYRKRNRFLMRMMHIENNK